MSYGTIKVDTITFTDNGSDVSVSVSGLAKNPTISGDLTVTGTISGNVLQGGTTVSGATVTGTTANFVSGVYTTQISGATITGDAGQFTTLTGGTAGFTTVTGTTVTGTTSNFVSGVFTTEVSGATITGDAGEFTTLTGGTAGFTTITGTTVTGTTANFVTISGTTVTGDAGQFTLITGVTAGFTTVTGTTVTGDTGNFTSVSATTATITSGVFASGTAAAPSVSVGTTDNGLYSPGTDEVAISTNGVGRVFIDASGNVGVNAAPPTASNTAGYREFLVKGGNTNRTGILRLQDGDGTDTVALYANEVNGAELRQELARPITFWTDSTEKLRITSDGKVGIGTNAPRFNLSLGATTVASTSTPQTIDLGGSYSDTAGTNAKLRLYWDGTSQIGLGVSAGQFDYIAATGNSHVFHIGSTERTRIDASGRLLVGTSSSRSNFNNGAGNDPLLQVERAGGVGDLVSIVRNQSDAFGPVLDIGKSRGTTVGSYTLVNDNDNLGRIWFNGADGSDMAPAAAVEAYVDGTPGANDMPGRLVFSTTADGASSPTERFRINSSGAFGIEGANFGSAGQVLVSNGSSAAPSWEQITPTAVFGWDHDDDTYGLYLPGTSIKTSDLTGTVDIDVQSRIRRCVINDSGVVQYYLDADDSDLKSGDWLRIVETEALDTAYTGTISESTNSLLRVGVPAWAAGTFTLGQRVTHSGSLWECIAATTTATPGAGTVASDLTGTDGQVVVEIPAFSVRYGFLNGVHTREVKLGCSDALIAQGFQPHPAFIKTDGSYKDAFYIGAYHTYDDSGTGSSVSGQTNTRSQTRATFRTEAEARGTGWHVLSYLELAAIQTLLVCEYQDYNSQRAIGNGADAGTTYGVTTGQSDGDGNHSVNSTDNVSDADDYMAYRGIENLYGRAWQWVDGINVYERVVYLTNDQTAFDDDTSDGYEFYAQVPSGSASYQKELQPLADVFLPSVVTGGSSTTYLGDAFWTSTGWRVGRVGGGSADGARDGAFCLRLGNVSGISSPNSGSRLCYAAN